MGAEQGPSVVQLAGSTLVIPVTVVKFVETVASGITAGPVVGNPAVPVVKTPASVSQMDVFEFAVKVTDAEPP